MSKSVKPPPQTTLIQVQSGSTRLGVVQYRDGVLAITCNDQVVGVRRWEPGEVEACINAYLRIARDYHDDACEMTSLLPIAGLA